MLFFDLSNDSKTAFDPTFNLAELNNISLLITRLQIKCKVDQIYSRSFFGEMYRGSKEYIRICFLTKSQRDLTMALQSYRVPTFKERNKILVSVVCIFFQTNINSPPAIFDQGFSLS